MERIYFSIRTLSLITFLTVFSCSSAVAQYCDADRGEQDDDCLGISVGYYVDGNYVEISDNSTLYTKNGNVLTIVAHWGQSTILHPYVNYALANTFIDGNKTASLIRGDYSNADWKWEKVEEDAYWTEDEFDLEPGTHTFKAESWAYQSINDRMYIVDTDTRTFTIAEGWPPPTASINGPSSLDGGENGTWTAQADGGDGSYAYRWYYKAPYHSSWQDAGVTSSSYSRQMNSFWGDGFDLRVRVTSASKTVYATKHVVNSSLHAAINGPSSLNLGEQGTWQADVSGGSGNYSYDWDYLLDLGECGPSSLEGGVGTNEVNQCAWYDGGSGSSFSRSTSIDATLRLRLTVTDGGNDTDQTTKYVTIGDGPGGGLLPSKQAAARDAAEISVRPAPETFTLESPAPNPFRSQATLQYGLPEEAEVSVTVYDALGREVAQLAGGSREAGWHRVRFEAGSLPAGRYLVRMQVGSEFATTKQVVLVE